MSVGTTQVVARAHSPKPRQMLPSCVLVLGLQLILAPEVSRKEHLSPKHRVFVVRSGQLQGRESFGLILKT